MSVLRLPESLSHKFVRELVVGRQAQLIPSIPHTMSLTSSLRVYYCCVIPIARNDGVHSMSRMGRLQRVRSGSADVWGPASKSEVSSRLAPDS